MRQIALQPTQALNVRPEHLEVIKNALVGVPREGHQRAGFRRHPVRFGRQDRHRAGLFAQRRKVRLRRVDERLRDHAWYIAYAPADHPRIAIAVLVENGGFGAQAAAPIARAVFDYYLLGRRRAAAAPGSGPREPDDESG